MSPLPVDWMDDQASEAITALTPLPVKDTCERADVRALLDHDLETGLLGRATFTGVGGKAAKCDVAIPDKAEPLILIESKAYGATGSKMTDVIGDLDHIIQAKRHDAALLVVTDGITWKARQSDMAKIVERQNDGRITRIHTTEIREQFLDDLRILKGELGLQVEGLPAPVQEGGVRVI